MSRWTTAGSMASRTPSNPLPTAVVSRSRSTSRPMTAATWRTPTVGSGSRAIRRRTTSRTPEGTSPPLATATSASAWPCSVDTRRASSVAKNGLPSARTWIAAVTSGSTGRPAAPSTSSVVAPSGRPRSWMRRVAGARDSAASASTTASLRPTSSWRTVQASSTGESTSWPDTNVSSSSEARSAHWMSSSTRTSGRSAAAAASSPATASNSWNRVRSLPVPVAASSPLAATSAEQLRADSGALRQLADQRAQRGQPRPEGGGGGALEGPAPQDGGALGAGLGRHLLDQAGLADARLALDQHHPGPVAGLVSVASSWPSSASRPTSGGPAAVARARGAGTATPGAAPAPAPAAPPPRRLPRRRSRRQHRVHRRRRPATAGRGRGGAGPGGRSSVGVLAEDGRLQLDQRAPGVDAELVAEGPAGVVEDAQRLGLAARTGTAPGPCGGAAARAAGGRPPARPARRRPRRGGRGGGRRRCGPRWPPACAPPAWRRTPRRSRGGRTPAAPAPATGARASSSVVAGRLVVSGQQQPPALVGQGLEAAGVERLGPDRQLVAGRVPGEDLGGLAPGAAGHERPAQPRHVALEGAGRRVGRAVAPQRLDDRLGRDDPPPGHQQHGQHRARLRAPDVDGRAVDAQPRGCPAA